MENLEEKSKETKEKKTKKNNVSNTKSRITKEYNKLVKVFISNSPEKKHVIQKLIKRASFLLVLAEDMERSINDEELLVETVNASQSFTKSNPLLKDYRDTVKSYQTVLKQLCDLVKNESSGPVEPDELEAFIKLK